MFTMKNALRVIADVAGVLATLYAILVMAAGGFVSGSYAYLMVGHSIYTDAFLTPFIIGTLYALMFGYLSYVGIKRFLIDRKF